MLLWATLQLLCSPQLCWGINILGSFIHSGKEYKRSDVLFNIIPPFLAYGILLMHLVNSAGASSMQWMKHDPDSIAEAIIRGKINRFAGSPDCVDALMKKSPGDMSYLIEYTGAGEKLSPVKEELINNFFEEHNAKTKWFPAYGMTECTASIAMTSPPAHKMGTAGIPLSRMNIKCVDLQNGDEVPFSKEGEICVSGPTLMLEFYKNETATKEVIEYDSKNVRWLHTGDLGYMDEDGFLFITGRLKRTFFTKGSDGAPYRLFPQRIEEFVESIDIVSSCGIITKEDRVRVNVPVAYLTLATQAISEDAAAGTINSACLDELPEHLRPIEIHILDTMPVTVSGKIDYRALEKLANEMH